MKCKCTIYPRSLFNKMDLLIDWVIGNVFLSFVFLFQNEINIAISNKMIVNLMLYFLLENWNIKNSKLAKINSHLQNENYINSHL